MAGNHKMIQVLMRICATLWDEKRVIVDNRFCYISCYVYIYISRNISYSSSSSLQVPAPIMSGVLSAKCPSLLLWVFQL